MHTIFHTLITVMYTQGGMAAFMLQLFHKFEKNASKGKWNKPCKWLKHKADTPGHQN